MKEIREYRVESFCRARHGHPLRPVHVVKAPNGKEIAECSSQEYAKKVAKGLRLVDIEKIKMDNFRI
jgi:hypothetical protein